MGVSDKQAEQDNQKMWDELASVHLRAYHEVRLVREGQTTLDETELREIGDVSGKTLLHLQCHIGTDTLSWARQGATVTGVDFSGESIACARKLQEQVQVPATFIESNIYDLPKVLSGEFDIVYASRGVLCWLKDLAAWGRIIAKYLKPGGIFYLMESHPILQIFDDTASDGLPITLPYFHEEQPRRWDSEVDYADGNYIRENHSYEWSWSMGDIINALVRAGLTLEFLHEYDRLFYQAFPAMVECRDRWYDFPEYRGKLPLMFTLRASKQL